MIQNQYFKKHSLEHRQSISKTLLEKNCNHVPCVINIEGKDTLKLKKPINELKILISGDFILGELIALLRKRINISQTEGVYLFIDNRLIPTSCIMRNVYNKYKHQDGFLYIDLRFMETFG